MANTREDQPGVTSENVSMRWFSRGKEIARLFLPPVVVKLGRRMGRQQWEYVADQWPENNVRSFGWDDPSVATTLRTGWNEFARRAKGSAPLTFSPWSSAERDITQHNLLMTFGYVLARTAYGKTQVSVLDWGGAIGHYALIAKCVLPEVRFDYTIKERPGLCAIGRDLLPEVRFTASDEKLFRAATIWCWLAMHFNMRDIGKRWLRGFAMRQRSGYSLRSFASCTEHPASSSSSGLESLASVQTTCPGR